MTKYAKKIAEADNVVTALSECKAGEEVTVRFKGQELYFKCNQDIPFAHKLAISDIQQGSNIIKYAEKIGIASKNIAKGDWVHIHNVKDDYKCLSKDGTPLPGQDD